MKKINEYFSVSDDAVYKLVSPATLILKDGSFYINSGIDAKIVLKDSVTTIKARKIPVKKQTDFAWDNIVKYKTKVKQKQVAVKKKDSVEDIKTDPKTSQPGKSTGCNAKPPKPFSGIPEFIQVLKRN
jgi:hypothetical protein